MRWGILSGSLWGLDTVILGVILTTGALVGNPHASLLSALFHDAACAILLTVLVAGRGRLRETFSALRTRSGLMVAGAALLGGPIGMSAYLIAIDHIGPGNTAVISTFYPAVGTVLAVFLLKERMGKHQVLALLLALGAIVAMSYSTAGAGEGNSPVFGTLAALGCVVGWGSEATILAAAMNSGTVTPLTAVYIREMTSALTYLLVIGPMGGIYTDLTLANLGLPLAIAAGAACAGTFSYLFYYRAISALGAARAMALNISYSAWAVFFSFLILHVTPSLWQGACCLLILGGTVLAATPHWRELMSARRSA